ncbi:MAG: DUF1320 domain-containing protein [Thermomonas sp.]|uniref:gp436 family protein n=1 Tax=Thermomonas sp. TaxID=1971895 RepID=UPI0026096CDD|nr:DUF1320 domain-containing protein [Thermomonas sp.]MCC7097272.1 DUF1320 domain-containing protein [Thermomonas sp.]
MSYATLDMLTARYGERLLLQLTDRATPPAGAVDSAIVDAALGDTDAVIDGYLAGRYALPLSSTPPLLADLAQAIAIYKLHPFMPDPKIEQDYKDAMTQLDRISRGTVRLPLEGVEPAGTDLSGVVTTDRDRPFTAENLTGFI